MQIGIGIGVRARAYTLASGAAQPLAVASRLLAPPQQRDPSKTFGKPKTWHRLFVSVNGPVQVWWPNFITAQGGGAPGGGCSDIAPGAAATGTAQIVYTARVGGAQVTVNMTDLIGATAALAAPDGGWFKATASIDALAGTLIYAKLTGNFPAGILFSLGKADAANGDRFEFGTSAIPLANDPVDTFPSFRTWYGPCLIAAPSGMPVAALIEDSRGDGLKDMVNDATGNIGVFMRLFGASVPVVNLSGRGDMAQSFASPTHSARRRELLAFATFKAHGLGINDFAAGNRTAAQVLADQATISAINGTPSIYRTQNPFTVGGIVTPWNAGDEAQRQAYNAAVRAMSAYFDPDGVLSTGASGGWTNEDAVNIDYLHETNIGNAYAAANGAAVGMSVGVHGVASRAAGPVYPSWGTNLFTFNRDMANGAWAKNDVGAPITGQPDAEAGNTAQKLAETATTNKHSLARGPIAVTPGTFETWMDIAPAGRDWVFFQIIDQTFGYQALAWFNVTIGVLGSTFSTNASFLNLLSATITPVVGTAGFYRCKMVFSVGAAVTSIYVSAKFDLNNGADSSYLGDTSKGIVMRPQTWLRQTVVAPVADTFDPANKSGTVNLSEANIRLTVAAGPNDQGSRSIQSRSAGKVYAEFEIVSTIGTVGVGNASAAVTSWIGSSGNSRGYDMASGNSFMSGASTGATGIGVAANGNVIGIAIDFTAGKMWFSKNGVFGSGQDPVAGTGGFNLPAGALYAMGAGNPGASYRFRSVLTQFLTAPPTGFTAWVP